MRGARAVVAVAVVIARMSVFGQQTPAPVRLVQWVAPPEASTSWLDHVKRGIESFSEFLVRSTSPDMAHERWLWMIARDGTGNHAIAPANGARHPRWGSSGWIAVETETDTNGDNRIDARDALHLSLIPAAGGASIDIGAGESPVWSPDGKQVAFVRAGRVTYYDVAKKSLTESPAAGGLVYSDRRSLTSATKRFWLLDTATGAVSTLGEDSSRYLWLGTISTSGDAVAYHDNQRSAILIKPLPNGIPKAIFRDAAVNVDPSWSPDGKSLVYVSTRKPLG